MIMKLSNIIKCTLLLVSALFYQSCSDSKDGGSATALEVTQDGVVIDQVSFAMGEASTMLGVKTDAEWTVSVPDADTTWLSVTPHQGYGWNITDSTASNYRSYFKVTAKKNTDAPRTSTLTVTAGGLTKTIQVAQKGISGNLDGHENAWTMVENFILGYNMGNNLECNPYGSWWDASSKTPKDWETAWGQPEITATTIATLKAKGFNVIRIPVTWYPHMKKFDEGNYIIDAAWMARVKEVVDMVRAADMYCIINIQHDAGANNGSGDAHSAWLHAGSDYETVSVIYKQLWQQIATTFKDYDDKLIFESFNEILNESSSWTAPSAGDVAYTTINKLQQDFVNTVRATGGNNRYRNLLISTYADGTTQVCLDELQVPDDEAVNHLCATFHSYDPYWFCNDSEGSEDYYINYFGDDQKSEIDAIFQRVDKRCGQLGIPYFFGEFGAIGSHPAMAERAKYADYITKKFNEYQTAGLYWSGLLDRNTQEWTESEIVDAMVANRVK